MIKIDDNFLLINKPAGWTSFDAVNFIRKKYREANKKIKVGHAGTLDPFATGLLIVGVGREATKRLDEFKNLPKTYEAVLFLGATSNTGDPTGEITLSPSAGEGVGGVGAKNEGNSLCAPSWKEGDIEKVLKKFVGPQEQTPPMFSAKKINGQRLYKLARQGQTVERPSASIEIYDIKLSSYIWPYLKIEVSCSAGTYIRTLAQDIGQALGTGAYCLELKRTAIGPYTLKEAQTL